MSCLYKQFMHEEYHVKAGVVLIVLFQSRKEMNGTSSSSDTSMKRNCGCE
jgi:hypothetical protein